MYSSPTAACSSPAVAALQPQPCSSAGSPGHGLSGQRSLSGLRPGNCGRDQRPAVSDHRSAVSKARPAVRSSGQRSQSIRSRPGLKVKTDQAGQIPARSPVSIRSQRPAVSKSRPRPGGQIPPGHGLRSARSETRGARSDSVRSPVSARSHNLAQGQALQRNSLSSHSLLHVPPPPKYLTLSPCRLSD